MNIVRHDLKALNFNELGSLNFDKEIKVITFDDFDNLTKEEQESMKKQYDVLLDIEGVVIGSRKEDYYLSREDYQKLQLVTPLYYVDDECFCTEKEAREYVEKNTKN